MEFKFTQYEIESRAYRILEHGDESKIAERIGRGSSYISQMYNPDDERESNISKAAKEIAAEMDISLERGCKLLRLFVEVVERHIPKKETRCVQSETKKFNHELREYYDADMCNEPIEKQISELLDVEAQARELIEAKQQEIEKQRIRQDNGFVNK